MKLLAVATHPIQYQAPWFRGLAARAELDLVVAFATIPDAVAQGAGFGVAFDWDLPLLEGYRSRRLQLRSPRAAIDRFFGLNASNLGTTMREEAPTAVLLTGWNSYVLLQALAAARRARIPTIVRGESNGLRRRRRAVRWIHRGLLRRFDVFLAIGAANRRFYLENGVAARRLFEAPYFVDNERFGAQARSLEAERESLRLSWAVPGGSLCVLFAGKLVPKKRPLDLVEALARARPGRDLHLLVAGDGALRDEVAERCRVQGVAATFTGFLNQTEIARAYVAADLLVLPSDAGETWGLVVNEAMACGRPAIVSDAVGCREDLILEEQTGWSYPCGRVDALSKLLERAALSGEKLVSMGEAARRRIHKRYSVERAVEGTLRACEAVARGRHR